MSACVFLTQGRTKIDLNSKKKKKSTSFMDMFYFLLSLYYTRGEISCRQPPPGVHAFDAGGENSTQSISGPDITTSNGSWVRH